MLGMASLYGIGLGAGLVGLWLAGDKVVAYAVRLAQALHVTKFFIGFIVLAIAAGVPELAVAISSALADVGEISAGDVIGASLSDIALVTAIVLMVGRKIPLRRSDRAKLMRMLLVVSGVFALIFYIGTIDRVLGFFLTFFYGIALFFIWQKKPRGGDVWHEEVDKVTKDILVKKPKILWKDLVFAAAGFMVSIAFVLSLSWLTVYSAVGLAGLFAARLEVVGATICALGTSLPELAMSLSAIRNNEYELAIAPTLGSILEHAMLVLGILGMTSKRSISFVNLRGAAGFMFLSFALMFIFLWLKRPLARWQGVILITLYVAYLVYELMGYRLAF